MTKVAVIAASVLMTMGFTGVGHAGGKASIDPGAPAEGARQVAKKAPPPAKKTDAPAWRKAIPAPTSTDKKQGPQGMDPQGTQAQGTAR